MSEAVRTEPLAPTGTARPREPARPLRATVGEPALLDLPRGPLQAPVRARPPEAAPAPEVAPAPEPEALSLAELQAALAAEAAGAGEEEPEGDGQPAAEPAPREDESPAPACEAELERAYFGVALSEDEVIFVRARAAAEDLGLLGAMRRPLPDQGWAGRAEAERRLLARVDAIAACGEKVLPRLIGLLEERPVPDAHLSWALLFLLGSLAGDDAADEAMRLAHAAALDADGMVEALADALALAPHPALSVRIAPWLSAPEPERRRVAVSALSRRGALETPQAAAAAGDPDSRVAAVGAAALATSAGPVDGALLLRLARSADEAVARAALESALVRRSEVAPRRARELVAEQRADFAGAALVLGVAGTAEDLPALRAGCAAGSALAIEALGWLGHADAVDDLLEQLGGACLPAALEALQRITGATLIEADAAPEYEPGKGPFTQAQGPVPLPVPLCPDAEAWRAWWRKHGMAARRSIRWRFGHPWSPSDDLGEIELAVSTRGPRRLAFLELCARTGATSPLDLDAFVARQRRELVAWVELVSAGRVSPGTWPVKLGR
jgi:hypothetical protein